MRGGPFFIITDADDSFCAEDCVSQVVESGMGKSVLRDCNTPILKGLSWDSPDSLCVVNSFASEASAARILTSSDLQNTTNGLRPWTSSHLRMLRNS